MGWLDKDDYEFGFKDPKDDQREFWGCFALGCAGGLGFVLFGQWLLSLG